MTPAIKSILKVPFFYKLIVISLAFLIKVIKAFAPQNGKSGVVIISLHKIGDTVFTIPAVKAIYDYFPDPDVTILCFPEGKEIYEYYFKNCKTATLSPDMFWMKGRIAGRRARKILKQLDPEIIFSLSASFRITSLLFNSPAKKIIGADKELFKEIYTTFSPFSSGPPLTSVYTDIIKSVVPVTEQSNNLYPEPSFNPEDKILIHPFAGWQAKEWGIDKFIRLAKRLNQDHNVEFVIDDNIPDKQILSELNAEGFVVNSCKSITELLNCINSCSVMISNDTGCIYLAAISGKATYTIYGPTNPLYSMPVGKQHSYIQKIIKCSPLSDQYCFTFAGRIGCPSFECMRLLSPEEVSDHLEMFLESLGLQKIYH